MHGVKPESNPTSTMTPEHAQRGHVTHVIQARWTVIPSSPTGANRVHGVKPGEATMDCRPTFANGSQQGARCEAWGNHADEAAPSRHRLPS